MKIALRALTAAALVYAGAIHLHLATRYDGGGALSVGNQFRLQFAVSIVAALVLLIPRRWALLPAVVVAVATLGAVLASVYLTVPAIGPIAALPHEPWYMEKSLSAIAEGAVVLLGASLMRARTPPTGEATASGLNTK
ncbi:MAG: hypothetical protein WCB04_11245 [Mycobacteriales bacterium]